MPRGGAREGAGRKAGAKSQKTIQREKLAADALANGMTPLQVMLSAMEEAYQQGDKRGAAAIAKDAAPYIHPRLSTVDMNATVDGKSQIQFVNEFHD